MPRVLGPPLILLVALACAAPAAAAPAAADFNGDGRSDLAIGIPLEDTGGHADVGAVAVLYGTPSGLTGQGSRLLVPADWDTAAAAGARFGFALAAGDFDGDGVSDLAIGAPGDLGGAGRVYVVYGSSAGLGNRSTLLDQATSKGVREAGDLFGSALVAGSFNPDRFDDLAIGVPGEDVRATPDAGAVNVVYGGAKGLGRRSELWSQGTPGIDDSPERGDRFGAALAAGDFGRSVEDELAIGVPGEGVPGAAGAGAVAVLYGTRGPGLTARDDQLWHEDSPGVPDAAEVGDGFGAALAAGDLGRDSRDDLAVGVPLESVGPAAGAGAVTILYGDASVGLRADGSQLFTQDSPDVAGTAADGDWFGYSLAVGALDGDAYVELAVGVPAEDVDGAEAAGAVAVLHGAAAGLTTAGDELWHQDVADVADRAEPGDRFGLAVAIGAGWLAAGVPGEDLRAGDGGAVAVLQVGPTGLTSAGNQLFDQDSPGLDDAAQTGDAFGATLAPGP